MLPMPTIVASVNKVTHQATKTGIGISSFMRKPKLSLDINAANAYDGISAPHRRLRWRLVQAGKSQLGELGNVESPGESLPCEFRGAQTNNAGIENYLHVLWPIEWKLTLNHRPMR